jgi:ABC-type multidrug transport system fused ATPase/permease subunit
VIANLRQYVTLLLRAPGDRVKLATLLAMLVVAAALEAVGLGVVMPFVALLERPSLVQESRLLRWVSQSLGLSTPPQVMMAVGAALLGVFLAKNVYMALVIRVQMRFVYNRMTLVARSLLLSYLRRPYTFHLQKNSAELVRAVVNDCSAVFYSGVPSSFTIAVESLTCAVIGLTLLALEPMAVSIVGVLIGGGAYYFQSLYRRRSTALGAQVREATGEMVRHANQALGGIKEARIIGCEETFADEFDRSNRAHAEATRQQRTLIQLPRQVLETFGVAGIVATTVIVLARGTSPERVLPVLGVMALAVVRLLPSVMRILGAIGEVRYYSPTVTAFLSDLATLEGESGRSTGVPALAFERAITLNDVGYTYPEAPAPSLAGVSLEIRRGEAIAFVGGTGAGKTTLADVLIGLLTPTAGSIEVDGVALDGTTVRRWQRLIGYISQQVYLCDDTLRRNIALGVPDGQIDEERVRRAVTIARLDELVASLPQGLDTSVGERGVRLSGGQRQRIGIARAMYLDPPVLILDEATSALDNVTEQQVVEAMEAARERRTMIVIAHRLSTVRRCDRLVVMGAGRVEHVGTWDDLLAQSETFRALVEGGAR